MQREPVVAFFEQEFITLAHALEDGRSLHAGCYVYIA